MPAQAEATSLRDPNERRNMTKSIRVYDPPMCCSTGVCGPSVDPELVRVAADLKWAEGRGAKATVALAQDFDQAV